MIKSHKFNRELSLQAYEGCKELLEVKQCYVNVFHVLTQNRLLFRSGQWKVAYGYMKALPDYPIMARHCFIVNEEMEAIDPTFFTFNRDNEKEYYSFYIFDQVDEYLDAISKNNGMPDLMDPLMKFDLDYADPWAFENEYLLIR